MALNITVYPLTSPRVIQVDAPQTEATIQDLYDAIRDWEDDSGNNAFDFLIDAAGGELLGGGVSVGTTATLQNAQIYFEGRSTAIANTKLCTAASVDGRLVLSSTSTFVTDTLTRGDTVVNYTTMAMATILSIDSETQLTTLPLTGGSRQDWQVGDVIYTYDQVQCNLSGGNMVAIDSLGAELAPVLEGPMVQVVRTAASSATATSQEALEAALFGGAVCIDTAKGVAGTGSFDGVPVGTRQTPSDNIADAKQICIERGFNHINFITSYTILTEDLSVGFKFSGDSPFLILTIAAAADVTNCSMHDLTIVGEMDGLNLIDSCRLLDVTSVSGMMHKIALSGNVTLSGALLMMESYSNWVGEGHTGVVVGAHELEVRDFHGSFGISGMTGGTHSIGITEGRLIIDADCTGGTVYLRGDPYEILDLSGGAVTLIDHTTAGVRREDTALVEKRVIEAM